MDYRPWPFVHCPIVYSPIVETCSSGARPRCCPESRSHSSARPPNNLSSSKIRSQNLSSSGERFDSNRGKFGASRIGRNKRIQNRGNPVPEEGVEPSRPCGHWILNPARLPFRHSGKKILFYRLAGTLSRRPEAIVQVLCGKAAKNFLPAKESCEYCVNFFRLPTSIGIRKARCTARPCLLIRRTPC
jgi:hypothetical protein